MSSFTKVLFVILATIRLAEAQDPATEEEWRAIHAKTKREYDSANSGRWSGVVLVGVGTSLAIYGGYQNRYCAQGPGGLARAAGACDRYGYHLDWRLVGPGLGTAGAGMALLGFYSHRRHKRAEQLEKLEQIRKQRQWTVSSEPASVRLAFHW